MLRVLFLLLFAVKAHAFSLCSLHFLKLVKADLSSSMTKNPFVNLWDERFNSEFIVKDLRMMEESSRVELLSQLSQFVYKDEVFNQNMVLLLNQVHQEKLVKLRDLKSLFISKPYQYTSFYYSNWNQLFTSKIDISSERTTLVSDYFKNVELPQEIKNEYKKIITYSNLDDSEVKLLVKNAPVFHNDKEQLEIFRDYLDYLGALKPYKRAQGLREISKIYSKLSLDKIPFTSVHGGFKRQREKLAKFEKRRIKELSNDIKILNENKKMSVSSQYKILNQAKHETTIFKRLLNSCSSGNSKHIEETSLKFSRFKYSLALGANPAFYLYTNWDKKNTDQYFWEKFGYEVFMGFFYTFVGNKIITNTNSSFWGKYFTGMVQFNALLAAEAYSYEILFGKDSMIRFFQKIYKGEVPETELEKQYKELINDPEFKAKVSELLKMMKEQEKVMNTKKYLDKYLDLSASSKLEDSTKITGEDLQTEESKEFLMELLAERIYLENMGNMPLFQTGRTDLDRYFYYSVRDIPWNLKGLIVNLAIYDLICKEPFGKVGSWLTVMSIVVADRYFDGSIGYQLRREAINQ